MLKKFVLLAALALPGYAFGVAGVYTDTLTGDTSGDEKYLAVYGGSASFTAIGDFGGGTLSLETIMPNGATGEVPNASWSDDAILKRIDAGGCVLLRVKLINSTAPSIEWALTPKSYKVEDLVSADCSDFAP